MSIAVDDFRQRAREWLAEHAPELRLDAARAVDRLGSIKAARHAQAALFDAGFAGITWPTAYGGQGLTAEHEAAFAEESAPHELPTGVFTIGLGMCGPLLLSMGSENQKQRLLPALLRGDEIWCQLFSEPEAGSDIAALRTRATPSGDGTWTVNGQKVWTSFAQIARRGVLIARTDLQASKHAGLSAFVLDMASQGVATRPLRQITGNSDFNEVFFDEVTLRDEDMIGTAGQGWTAVTTMLMHERVAIGARRRERGMLSWPSLYELAHRTGVANDLRLRDRLVDVYARERAVELLGARIASVTDEGSDPGPVGSVAKLAGAFLTQQAADLALDIAGSSALCWTDPDDDTWSRAFLDAPRQWIAGGTADIQRNIIGERLLGLPREPR